MKHSNTVKILGSLLALLLLLAALAPGEALARKNRYEKLLEDAPPLRDFQIPDVIRREMENGLVVYLIEDHDLPLIDIRALIHTGSMYDIPSKVGLADLVGEVMRTGGSSAWPGDELDVYLENLGAGVETGMAVTRASASLSCLSENVDELLPIFADILRRPIFPEDKIGLAKTQIKTLISRRNDSADDIARREIMKLYYGAESPYARDTDYEHLAAIERGDLQAFHEYYYHPDNMILVMGGDFDTERMFAALEDVFGDWPAGDTFFLPDPMLEKTPMSINYIRKDDVNQSKVRMGHLGIRWDDEYVFPMQLINNILGGGFASRLMTEVRTRNELAYSAYAVMIVGNHHEMPFIVGTDTKSESTVEAIEVILRELHKIREELVTREELAQAKSALKNAFVFNFSNPFSIARRKATYEFWGRDADYLDTYLAKVDAVTREDILEAARARIHPDQMAILVVGKEEDFDKPLASLGLGEPNIIDITIPEPRLEEEAIPAATEASLAQGAGLMRAAREAHGGEKAMRAIGSRETSSDFIVQDTPMGAMTFSMITRQKGDDRIRIDTNTPFGSMVQILTAEQGWMQSPRGSEEMSASDLEESWKSERRDLLNVFKALDDLRCQSLGEQEFEGRACDVIHVIDADELKVRFFLDAETHMVRAMEFRDSGQAGPVLNLSVFGEYEKAGGVQFARAIRIHHDGKLFAELLVKDVKINPELSDDLYRALGN